MLMVRIQMISNHNALLEMMMAPVQMALHILVNQDSMCQAYSNWMA